MYLGSAQAITYGIESSHGYPVVPSVNLGIVTGGNLNEESEVYSQVGTSSKVTTRHLYAESSCGASCSMLLQDPSILMWGITRSNPVATLPSCTVDCGVSPRRRMVGSKINSMSLSMSIGNPLVLDIEWMSIYAGEASSYTIPGSSSYPIWVPGNIAILYGGDVLYELTGLDISISNNLIRRYMANRQNANPRACSWIDDGVQTIEATIKSYDKPAVECRILAPIRDNLVVSIGLLDMCSPATAILALTGCLQKQVEEPLSPNQPVEFSNHLSVGGISYSYST